ncbi:MAG: hypothetical protein LH679_01500, partial [Cyanobacteria bacterium CAN_BIN43]|nr:hypothetical protein [Cyanobacteria bacterium CAN_BIN43]
QREECTIFHLVQQITLPLSMTSWQDPNRQFFEVPSKGHCHAQWIQIGALLTVDPWTKTDYITIISAVLTRKYSFGGSGCWNERADHPVGEN